MGALQVAMFVFLDWAGGDDVFAGVAGANDAVMRVAAAAVVEG